MRKFDKCPRCSAELVKATALNGGESTFWLKCSRCNTFINTFIPQEHQRGVLEDSHTFIGSFGGYGTGKTLCDIQAVYKHIFITPKANVLIGANVISQYEQTIKRDMENDIPREFIKSVSTQKQQWDFVNGARIMWRPLDDVDKVRSYNLTMFLIIEGSEVDPEAFIQLKTRLRNMAASKQVLDENGEKVYDETENGVLVPRIESEWRKGIIESNPDSGWIRDEVLFRADDASTHIYGTAMADLTKKNPERLDPNIAVHIAATDSNKFLPSDFIQQISTGKPEWWIKRYVYGSFDYSEGLVHPGYAKCIVPPRLLDHRRWKHIVAADYGLSDDFVYLFGLIDEEAGKLVIYKELVTNNQNVEQLAQLFKENCKEIPLGGFYTTPVLDPKSGAKRDYNKKDLYTHFAEYGVAFQPGQANVDIRVFRTNTYIETLSLEIFETCTYLLDELRDYKFNERQLGEAYKKSHDKPKDGNDHAICAMHFMICALPSDPSLLRTGSYDRYGNRLDIRNKAVSSRSWQLSDDTQVAYDNEFGMMNAGEW